MEKKLILFLFLLGSCSRNGLRITNVGSSGVEFQVNSKTPAFLFNKWYHAYEEDKKDDTKTYRPVGYPFPDSRGRPGFEIFKNGKFNEFAIGADDRPVEHAGRWIYGAKTHIIDVSFKKLEMDPGPVTKDENPPYSLEIIKLEENLLLLKKTNMSAK